MSAATLRRLIVIVLIALWEILPRAGLIPTLFLPSLSSTLIAGWNEAGASTAVPVPVTTGQEVLPCTTMDSLPSWKL